MTRIDPGVVSLVAELRGHERQGAEEKGEWKTDVKEAQPLATPPAAITPAMICTREELEEMERRALALHSLGYAVIRPSQAAAVGTNRTIEGQWLWKVMMRVIADLCLIPIGVGVSVSREIAACERVLAEAGLKTNLHAYGTNVEGEWDEVFAAIKRCHEVVHAMGTPRISSSLRFGTRIDRPQSMDDKVRSVEEKLAGSQ